ncbi:hypothetical protein QAD02_017670 [Eretmocerus hayati]|uniref:Uncharacterized protein n=1 Tax=Eretmocerus hayati TaxID=131215 RepID=A0ACC2PEH1_9HYME|nr:hypothetical protein QAD02_017670 [Eretmocerus hayati]
MRTLSKVRTRPHTDPAKLLGKKRGTGARAFLGCGLAPRSAYSHQDGPLERRKAEGTRESPSVAQPRYDQFGSPATFACLSARYHQPTGVPILEIVLPEPFCSLPSLYLPFALATSSPAPPGHHSSKSPSSSPT